MFEHRYNVFDDGDFLMSTNNLADVREMLDWFRENRSVDHFREIQVLEIVDVLC